MTGCRHDGQPRARSREPIAQAGALGEHREALAVRGRPESEDAAVAGGLQDRPERRRMGQSERRGEPAGAAAEQQRTVDDQIRNAVAVHVIDKDAAGAGDARGMGRRGEPPTAQTAQDADAATRTAEMTAANRGQHEIQLPVAVKVGQASVGADESRPGGRTIRAAADHRAHRHAPPDRRTIEPRDRDDVGLAVPVDVADGEMPLLVISCRCCDTRQATARRSTAGAQLAQHDDAMRFIHGHDVAAPVTVRVGDRDIGEGPAPVRERRARGERRRGGRSHGGNRRERRPSRLPRGRRRRSAWAAVRGLRGAAAGVRRVGVVSAGGQERGACDQHAHADLSDAAAHGPGTSVPGRGCVGIASTWVRMAPLTRHDRRRTRR